MYIYIHIINKQYNKNLIPQHINQNIKSCPIEKYKNERANFNPDIKRQTYISLKAIRKFHTYVSSLILNIIFRVNNLVISQD